LSTPVSAQSEPENIQKLLSRIEQLEKRLTDQEAKNAQLESQVRTMQGGSAGQVTPPLPPPSPQAAQAPPVAPIPQAAQPPQAAPAKTPGIPITAKPSVELYGFIKLDTAYDTAQVYPGNYAVRVQQPLAGRPARDQFSITANATRLGLNFKTQGSGPAVTSGKLEVDLYGGGTENKPTPMMRHAYFQVEWPASGVTLLAGQTWDVISPLWMPTANYSVGWWAGNIGYRHPQVRLSKEFRLDDGNSFLLQGALVRTMGHLTGERNTGVDAGFPTAQGRLAYSFPAGAGGKAAFGLSGHWGEEAYPAVTPGQPDVRFRSWSANLDMKIPMGKSVTLQGEAFTGRDLDSYLGGSNEAIRLDPKTATESAGGWLALSIIGSPKVTWNLGASVDDPRNSELSPGARSRNSSIFGNGYFTIAPSAQLLAELSYWATDYLGKPRAHAFRAQLSFQYTF
jgi:hypothetical protein